MKYKISAVSYLNTLPFLYGFQHSSISKTHDISLDYPALSAQKFINKQVDIGLIPVAAIPQLDQVHVISDYCIGAVGKVDSVLLVSDVPIHEIETILLDYQSRTSINLVRVLAKRLWNIQPKWVKAKAGYETQINGSTAGVIIGDRTFDMPRQFAYQYDLAEAWQQLTGKPFVFAAWLSHSQPKSDFLKQFNQSLKLGITHIDQTVKIFNKQNPNAKVNIEYYLKNSISYILDAEKRSGMELFLNELKELTPIEKLSTQL